MGAKPVAREAQKLLEEMVIDIENMVSYFSNLNRFCFKKSSQFTLRF